MSKMFLVIDNSGDIPRIELQQDGAQASIGAYVDAKFLTDSAPGDFVHYGAHMGEKIFIALGKQWDTR
jgi:hypothetical protein